MAASSTLLLLLLAVVVLALSSTMAVAARPGGFEEIYEAQEADRVQSLPGLPSEVGFRHFSGYVTVNETHGRALFYWLFEATHDVAKKPLVLWLNGGPGCSSVGYGALLELGPFLVQKGKPEIVLNPHSWNKEANMLFLESPAGVGFSYTNTTKDLGQFGDQLTAHDVYIFLLNWFAKFPQFKGHDLYLAGESYAGHYIPQLASKIVEMNAKAPSASEKMNLKGILIGNAAIDASSDDRGLAKYAWQHAVVSDEVYGAIMATCKFPDSGEESDNLYTPACTKAMVNSSLASGAASRRYRRKASPLGKMHRHRRAPYFDTYDPCGDYHVVDYLNRRDVQDALHANVSGSIPSTWQPCSDALTNWTDQPASTLPEIAGLVGKAGIRVWVLSGDTDDRVPVTSTRYALRKLGLKTVKPWKEWFTSDQVGGYTVVYDGGLTFVTVRGAGHMVPMITPTSLAAHHVMHNIVGNDDPPHSLVA
ncbi:hypothetical protein BRADI_1g29471v3 [Brachypodium distachyon]|uniref:Carboxypeptidase n=1 Tax=Brachypodium distachyon TaxID=15368 RepID=A0A0Q3JWZ8_BRADI|nr:hypothetical protein BRADI_1g29471v3 [Brachypodium distachyon]